MKTKLFAAFAAFVIMSVIIGFVSARTADVSGAELRLPETLKRHIEKYINESKKPETAEGDWLYAEGSRLYNASGEQVWVTGINWFGYNTGTNCFDGIWSANLDDSIHQISKRGFNLLRVPFSVELIKNWQNGIYPEANYNRGTNRLLIGKNSLEIFDYSLEVCKKNGLKVMIDIHSANSDPSGHTEPMWYNGDISEQDYIDALSWFAARYKNDDTIIAYDLKNEPHGKPEHSEYAKWDGSNDSNNWKYIAEKAAAAVLSENPNALIVVEGIEAYPDGKGGFYYNWWGGNLRGVKDYPLDLGEYQNKLVYSPHDYGPSAYRQPWFYDGYGYDSLLKDCWRDNWFYIHENSTAPLLIGEWGGFIEEPNLTWMTHLRTLIESNRLNHIYWCYNANSGDTGGLVEGDYITWDEQKYEFLKPVLWQENGRFKGLDKGIPLGVN